MDKRIRYYVANLSPVIEVGAQAVLVCEPEGVEPHHVLAFTTLVTAYDETTETIETENTVYVPAGT